MRTILVHHKFIGAAAFWYDLLSDGIRDQMTLHAGCPILKGTKWILNKWIYMYDNFQNFPCGPGRNMRFQPPSKQHYFSNSRRIEFKNDS